MITAALVVPLCVTKVIENEYRESFRPCACIDVGVQRGNHLALVARSWLTGSDGGDEAHHVGA